jgi:hypothetical protein
VRLLGQAKTTRTSPMLRHAAGRAMAAAGAHATRSTAPLLPAAQPAFVRGLRSPTTRCSESGAHRDQRAVCVLRGCTASGGGGGGVCVCGGVARPCSRGGCVCVAGLLAPAPEDAPTLNARRWRRFSRVRTGAV